MTKPKIKIRSKHLQGAEVSWFAPICNGDDDFLGNRNPEYKSNWENASNILLTADKLGYRNILCPSSYLVGQDTLTFASAVAPSTRNINLLTAIRCGEVHPPMLARALTTLDHILKGRLTVNIISSNLPGEELSSEARYKKSREVIEILKQCWTKEEIDFQGEFYNLKLPTTDPVKPYQKGGPLLYFGGYSPAGVDLCAEHCDVYLMWPDTEDKILELMENMSKKAASYNRTVDFGLRVHMIVRETEQEARDYAAKLISKLDLEQGKKLKDGALDAKSYGVSKQSDLRNSSDEEYYVEDNLWTGIGLARSGCGAALVGNPEQIFNKLQRYMDMGIRSFIFSGYPHIDEAKMFAKYVLPKLETFSMPIEQGRVSDTSPLTPLAAGKRT